MRCRRPLTRWDELPRLHRLQLRYKFRFFDPYWTIEHSSPVTTLEEEIEQMADEYRRIARFDVSLGLWNA